MDTENNSGREQVHQVGEDAALTVENPQGLIRVTCGEAGVIRVHAATDDSENDSPVLASREGDHLRLHTRGRHGPEDVEYIIEVPAGCAVYATSVDAEIVVFNTAGKVVVETVGGEIDVRGVAAATIRSVDGDVHLEDAREHIVISAVNGEVHAGTLAGTLRLDATNGDATITSSTLASFQISSMNGCVQIHAVLNGDGPYTAHATNGDLNVSLSAPHGADVTLHTTHGEMHVNGPVAGTRVDKTHWQGRVGDGGPVVRLESLNGDVAVHVRHGDDPVEFVAPPASDVPEYPDIPEMPKIPPFAGHPTPSPAVEPIDPGLAEGVRHDDTVAILARLEHGEISVEDALGQIGD